MNLNILCAAIAAVITTSSCERKILTGKPIPTKTDSVRTQMNNEGKILTGKPIPTKTDSIRTQMNNEAVIENVPKSEDYVLIIEPKKFNKSAISKAKVILTNNTKEVVSAGNTYFVEFYDVNTWKRLGLHKNMVFQLIGYYIEPSTSQEFIVNLKPNPYHPYDYKPGRYRITKDIRNSNKKDVLVSTEFTVE